MRTKHDLTGQRFGRWKVLNKIGYAKGHTMWLCRCDCGEERPVRQQGLLTNMSLSCGCYTRELASLKHRKDITGQRFGKLVALEDAGNTSSGAALWKCKCDCGNEKIIEGRSLRKGHSNSCNLCVVDVLGQTFSRWTVVKMIDREEGAKQVCECVCKCGTEKTVTVDSLLSGASKSCGCYRDEVAAKMNLLPNDEAQYRYMYRAYRSGANKRNLEWTLTKEEVRDMVVSNCFYCGSPPSNLGVYRVRQNQGSILVNGIDRVDNEKGYTKTNCVSCCKTCNMAKRDMPLESFIEWLYRLGNSKNLQELENYKGYTKNNLVLAMDELIPFN